MEHIVEATEKAVQEKNWYAAIVLALTMPDICGRLQDPALKSRARYEAWFDKYLLSTYQVKMGPVGILHTFLCASDCYALRCAFLHQGEFDIEDQAAQATLEKFHFSEPPAVGSRHRNQIDNALQLQVDVFCLDVCAAVRQWLADVATDSAVQGRMQKLARIEPAFGS